MRNFNFKVFGVFVLGLALMLAAGFGYQSEAKADHAAPIAVASPVDCHCNASQSAPLMMVSWNPASGCVTAGDIITGTINSMSDCEGALSIVAILYVYDGNGRLIGGSYGVWDGGVTCTFGVPYGTSSPGMVKVCIFQLCGDMLVDVSCNIYSVC